MQYGIVKKDKKRRYVAGSSLKMKSLERHAAAIFMSFLVSLLFMPSTRCTSTVIKTNAGLSDRRTTQSRISKKETFISSLPWGLECGINTSFSTRNPDHLCTWQSEQFHASTNKLITNNGGRKKMEGCQVTILTARFGKKPATITEQNPPPSPPFSASRHRPPLVLPGTG